MTEEQKYFSPEGVDEQVDQLFQEETRPRLLYRQQTGNSSQAERRLVRELQGYYRTEQQEDMASLERAWRRVSPHLAEFQQRPHVMDRPSSSDMLRNSQKRNRSMYQQVSERSREKRIWRGPGLLAAVLVAALLVGGLIALLNVNHQATRTGSPVTATPTHSIVPTPAPQPPGTTVYTTPASQAHYTGFAWSPDSRRIAALTDNGGVQIWDATTGAHKVNVSPPGQNEWILSIAWSPVSQDLAFGTNQHILIVDGQSGTILHSYASSVAMTGGSGSPYLNQRAPASGGFGYRAVAWSPDGKSLAASISFGATGSVQIWNVQTGTISSTFSSSGSYVFGAVAWSSDGKYLAAHGYDTQGGDPNVATDKIIVWQVGTRQVVFQQMVMMDGSDAPLYWQPQTYNLTFAAEDHLHLTLEIWDVLTGKIVHNYTSKGSDMLAFSPDGKELASDTWLGSDKNITEAIVITDTNSGVQIYTYKDGNGALAWSPNGRYIVSASGGQYLLKDGRPVLTNGIPQTAPSFAKVWVA